jgi:hypothetical protein
MDSSPTQLAANPYRPALLADMRALPFRDSAFAEVAQFRCLYHIDDRYAPKSKTMGHIPIYLGPVGGPPLCYARRANGGY